MHEISAICPLCQLTNSYGAELIGRYTLCTSCRGRFYIEVPPLGEPAKMPLASEPVASASAIRSTTLDDLLWDTQQGNRYIIQSLLRLERRLTWQSYGIVALCALALLKLALFR